jgi:hypothetical protein
VENYSVWDFTHLSGCVRLRQNALAEAQPKRHFGEEARRGNVRSGSPFEVGENWGTVK